MTKLNRSSNQLARVEELAAQTDARLAALNQALARHEGAREAVAATLAEAEERVAATSDEAELLRTVLDRLEGMDAAWRRNFEHSLATIVSDGLSLVFGEELQVLIQPSTKADMSAVDFIMKRGGQEEDVLDGQGGGYVNIIAFLLRVLLIVAARPLLRYVLVLDEPFAHLSQEFRHALAEMMVALIDRLGFQALMITQEREYVDVADVAYRAEIVHGATRMYVLKGAEVA